MNGYIISRFLEEMSAKEVVDALRVVWYEWLRRKGPFSAFELNFIRRGDIFPWRNKITQLKMA